MPLIAAHLARVKPSATLAMSQRARELAAQGQDIVALTAGEPDFDTPDHVNDAACDAIRRGETKYVAVDGIPELKRAVAAKFKQDNDLAYKPDEIMVSSGAKQIIYNAFMATLNAGDEVIIPAPYWTSYPDIVLLAGGEPVVVPGHDTNGYLPTPDAIAHAITPQTKWLMINSPSNPSGAVWPRALLAEVAAVLKKHPQVHILTDDIYEHLIYSNEPYATIAQVAPSLLDRTLTINGASKAYAMTGWRIGYAGGPATLMAAMRKIQGQSTSCAAAPCQWATVAALEGPQDFLADRREVYHARRDKVVAGLNAARGIVCPMPDGAFYVYPSCAALIGKTSPKGRALATDEDVAMALMEEAGVGVVHGAAFGASPCFRISYAASDEALTEGLRRISDFCQSVV